jgi:hypothetical protein
VESKRSPVSLFSYSVLQNVEHRAKCFGKLAVTQVTKQFPTLCGIPRFITTFIELYSEPKQISHILASYILTSILITPIQVISCLQVSRLKFRMHFSYLPCVLHTTPISSSLLFIYLKPNVVAEWLTLLLRIRQVPVSNLGPDTGYRD